MNSATAIGFPDHTFAAELVFPGLDRTFAVPAAAPPALRHWRSGNARRGLDRGPPPPTPLRGVSRTPGACLRANPLLSLAASGWGSPETSGPPVRFAPGSLSSRRGPRTPGVCLRARPLLALAVSGWGSPDSRAPLCGFAMRICRWAPPLKVLAPPCLYCFVLARWVRLAVGSCSF